MILKVWDNVEEGALCLLLFLIVAITFATVVTRYIFDLPLSYIDQLVPNMFVWVESPSEAAPQYELRAARVPPQ